ncbi:hypothetical protein Sbal625DRAFT_1675 [Shewanella baltica OS625]|nr:hypothetical protein Sbal625DRAFT_1675 [Shewanella baltica OS625]
MNESHGRSHASLHCTTFRRPAYQMANWPLNRDVVQVHPWMLDRPVHGADGRLANHPGSPFGHSRNLLIYKIYATHFWTFLS